MIRNALRRMLKRLGPKPIDGRFLQATGATFFTLDELRMRPRQDSERIIRSLCFNAYLGDHTSMCRVLGRYKVLVDTEDMCVSVHLLGEGFWEIWHTEATLQLLKPGMKAVDIGANLGYFSLLMSDIVGEHGSVHAFEPNPDMTRRLRRSLDINGFGARATVHEVALTDRDGEGLLVIPAGEPGGAHLVVNPVGKTGTSVRTQTFDSIPALADADYIKIDVEGFEDTVWRGMRDLVKRGRPLIIIMEFSGDCYRDSSGFLDEIGAAGFSIDLLDPARGIVPIERAEILSRETEALLLVMRR